MIDTNEKNHVISNNDMVIMTSIGLVHIILDGYRMFMIGEMTSDEGVNVGVIRGL